MNGQEPVGEAAMMETPQEKSLVTAVRSGPVEATGAEVIAAAVYQRAPTLLASDSGAGSEVRVWAPDDRLVRRAVTMFAVVAPALAVSAGIGVSWLLHLLTGRPPSLGWIGGLFGMLPLWMSLRDLRKLPRDVSTDGTGIAITTSQGARSLRWDEISEVEIERARGIVLALLSGTPVCINLFGFRSQQQKELIATIVARARLTPLDKPVNGLHRKFGASSKMLAEKKPKPG